MLVRDLAARGVRDVVLAPGSRSAPLAYALAEADAAGELTLHVRVDERTAGFLALGLARGSELVRLENTISHGQRAVGTDGVLEAAPARGTDAVPGPGGTVVPVAVVTTSGTAVANLHPAVLEAHHTGVPLLVLTADRPHELRGTGASQTTDQVGIFAGALRFAADVPAPDGRAGEHRDLVAVAARAVAAAVGARTGHPGPVHLNISFREPLQPSSPLVPDAGRSPRAADRASAGTHQGGTSAAPGGERAASPASGAWSQPVVGRAVPRYTDAPALPGDPPRTVVVAGDGAGPQARRLAEAHGWPLFAEPSSGACGGPNAVAGYRLVLGAHELAATIEQVVVLGRPTLSRPVQRLLGREDVAVTVVTPGGGPWPDPARNAALVVPGLAPSWFEGPATAETGGVTPDPPGFLAAWREAGRAAAGVLGSVTADEAVAAGLLSAPYAALAVARAVAATLGEGDLLVVGSSNPVRDLDLVLGLDGAAPTILANRGLAGIDGMVSTATGVALAAARDGRRTRALLGDLTFLHDAGGLLCGPDEPHANLQVIVVNDDGGSIFATLEHGALAAASPAGAAAFERVFGTPHGANLGQLCAGYGVDHQLVLDVPSLRHALQAPSHGIQVIEVHVPRAARLAESRDLAARVVAAVRAVGISSDR
ncbi:2-succinyl-5-enolpyruvyl-6-hydroxy-3-cyclohexene-1-carboxylic-acid synthase [Antribacter soli]|uniref:2-succinyl-5-enolpyruvyl-6-hydroxy-3- cyclohexene-1-carboxylic-acid synthase n=1 Tax=Antribacter soli TaxID=2910976 RepID=UPI0027E006FC|nr:2-succinyl-5-enolpyruvyl-6-hydroxy-3-cyclohexene-1-carboxylic-acid synthase [Antribacter soli]